MPSASLLSRTHKRPLAARVHDRLLARVVTGDLEPGRPLDVDQLAASCGVSRAIVEEALSRLAIAGLVQADPLAGTAVTEWSVDDMRARAWMLAGIARSAILAAPPAGAHVLGRLDATPAAFVQICVSAIARTESVVTDHVTLELAEPLAIFLTPAVLAAHGVAKRSDRLTAAIDAVIAAFDHGLRDDAAAAVDDLGAVLDDLLASAGERSASSA